MLNNTIANTKGLNYFYNSDAKLSVSFQDYP
jgi:hypothetical protein